MPAVDDLRVLADDARARGYEAVAESVEGVIRGLGDNDPVWVAEAHDVWMASLQKDGALLRLLGSSGPHTDECAFPTAIVMGVVRVLESWLTQLQVSVAEG